MEPDELILHKETIEIEGGRKLYRYSFATAVEPDDRVPVEPEATVNSKPTHSSEGAKQADD